MEDSWNSKGIVGGANRIRTDDLLPAGEALSKRADVTAVWSSDRAPPYPEVTFRSTPYTRSSCVSWECHGGARAGGCSEDGASTGAPA